MIRALLAAAAIAALPGFAGAQSRPFVSSMLSAVSQSLAAQPFYGSMLLNSFDFHLRQAAGMSEPQAAAYLKTEIEGLGRDKQALAKVAKDLGKGPVAEHRAGAILLANAASRPDQFRELADGLEGLKSGLGKAIAARLAAAKEEGGTFSRVLRRVPVPSPSAGLAIYDRRGQLEALFDGGGSYPAY